MESISTSHETTLSVLFVDSNNLDVEEQGAIDL